MINLIINNDVLTPSRAGVRAVFDGAALAGFRLDAAIIGPRQTLDKGGLPVMIPPRDNPDVNNCTPCQSPGRGRPH